MHPEHKAIAADSESCHPGPEEDGDYRRGKVHRGGPNGNVYINEQGFGQCHKNTISTFLVANSTSLLT